MTIPTRKHTSLQLIVVSTATILFCALAALIIVGGNSDGNGLPLDIAAIHEE